MIQQELVDYVKEAKVQGHSLDTVKSVLQQQGWSEADVNESIVAATMPAVQSRAIPKPDTSKVGGERKIPDYYISPLSALLALILFFSLVAFTGRVMDDIESIVAPYSASSIYRTAQYEKLSEKYIADIPSVEIAKLEAVYKARHSADSINHLFVIGILSAVFWVLAFVVHFTIGRSHRQFLPLSVPYFLTGGLYLVIALFEIISRLFERQAQAAVYIILLIFICMVTIAFIFYQKRGHAEKHL